jgi:hypothetical protein
MPQTGVFALDVSNGEEWQLSDYVEPSALIHDGTVLITERCWGTKRVYSVTLE